MKVVDAQDLPQLDASEVREVIVQALRGLTTGDTVQPKATIIDFPNGAGDVFVMPVVNYGQKLVGVKCSPFIPGLKDKGLNPVTAYTLVMSAETGEPLLLCDSLKLTTLRTAATTAIAANMLLEPDVTSLAIIGSSNAAQEHLRQLMTLRSWTNVKVYSPSIHDDSAMARARREQLISAAAATEIEFSKSVAEAVAGAEAIACCTSAVKPFLTAGDIESGALVMAIATDGPRAHEFDPTGLKNVDLYVDYRETAPYKAGDLLIATDELGWTPDDIKADLPELLSRGTESVDFARKRYFRSTGLGLEDLAIASLLI